MHHQIHKGMGGRKLKRGHWRELLPFAVRSQSIETVEESKAPLCMICHHKEHSGARNV